MTIEKEELLKENIQLMFRLNQAENKIKNLEEENEELKNKLYNNKIIKFKPKKCVELPIIKD